MSFVTTVMVGRPESECAKLGSEAMLGRELELELGPMPAEAGGARGVWCGVATVMSRSMRYALGCAWA